MDFTVLLIQAATAVTIMTSLLKAIPVAWTSRYPAYINGVLSVIAAIIVQEPTFNFVSLVDTVVFALFTAVLAGLAYNQFTSQLKSPSPITK